jgi:hypothetical protein
MSTSATFDRREFLPSGDGELPAGVHPADFQFVV